MLSCHNKEQKVILSEESPLKEEEGWKRNEMGKYSKLPMVPSLIFDV